MPEIGGEVKTEAEDAEAVDGAGREEDRTQREGARGAGASGAAENAIEIKQPGETTREKKSAEKEAKSTKSAARSRPSKNEREIAEALFNLATIAADADRDVDVKKAKKQKKASPPMPAPAKKPSNVGATTTGAGAVGTSGGRVASASTAYVGFPFGVTPPNAYASMVDQSFMHANRLTELDFVPRGKPFKNSAVHVYIAHFIDFTQQASRQQSAAYQEMAVDPGLASADAATVRTLSQESAGGVTSGMFGATAGIPFAGPNALANMFSGQSLIPGAMSSEMQQAQQMYFLNMMMQYATAFPMFGAGGFPPLAHGAGEGGMSAQLNMGAQMNMFPSMMPFVNHEGNGSGGKIPDASGGMHPGAVPMLDPRSNPMLMAMMGGLVPPMMDPTTQPAMGTNGATSVAQHPMKDGATAVGAVDAK